MRRGIVLISVAAAGLAGGPAASCELSDVLKARAAITKSEATYAEQRHVHYLTEPVSAAGRLLYLAPDRVQMIVERPKAESFTYQGGVLSIEGDTAAAGKEIPVDSQILLSTLFSALVGTLSGDEARLRSKFDLFFTDADCAWQMTLVPKAERARAKVEGIDFKGTKGAIEQIVLKLKNGDRSVLAIRESE
jgi:Outer membrane lipoprotein carrier protein LolA-like